MSKYARKKDTNHNEMAAALVERGCSVYDSSWIGRGFPDHIVTTPKGITFLLETKYRNGKLTPAQIKFQLAYTGALGVARTVDEAIRVFEWFERGYVARREEIAF